MLLFLALLLLTTALVLSRERSIGDPIGFWRSRAIMDRLSRLVPAHSQDGLGVTDLGRFFALAHRLLKTVDPSFASFEGTLTSLGVADRRWIIFLELGKILVAILVSLLLTDMLGGTFSHPAARWAVPPLAFLGALLVMDKILNGLSLSRRRKRRGELVLGIEFLCIFLEGGQSLDQAFRSFCDICGHALPHIDGIQRTLVADFKNGVSYDKAFERWAQNLGVEEARPLASLFAESLEHGTELVPHLRQFSADLAERRIAAARASIGTKSAQLNVVMVAFFLPAILTFVTAPAVTSLAAIFGAW